MKKFIRVHDDDYTSVMAEFDEYIKGGKFNAYLDCDGVFSTFDASDFPYVATMPIIIGDYVSFNDSGSERYGVIKDTPFVGTDNHMYCLVAILEIDRYDICEIGVSVKDLEGLSFIESDDIGYMQSKLRASTESNELKPKDTSKPSEKSNDVISNRKQSVKNLL